MSMPAQHTLVYKKHLVYIGYTVYTKKLVTFMLD